MVWRTDEDRWAVIGLHKKGLTVAAIKRETGFDRRFIKRWISRYESKEPLQDKKRSGRPQKLSEQLERVIEGKMRGKRRRSSRVVARDLKRRKIVDVSYVTVQKAAHTGVYAHTSALSHLDLQPGTRKTD